MSKNDDWINMYPKERKKKSCFHASSEKLWPSLKMDIAECYQDNYSVYNQSFFLDILFAYTVFFPQDGLMLTTYMLS